MPASDIEQEKTEKSRQDQELRIHRLIAFASGLFQGDVTIRTLLETLAEGVVIIDSTGTILLVNPRAEKIFDYPRENLIGNPLAVLIPERFRKVHEEHVVHFFDAPRIRPMDQLSKLSGLHRDGSEFPLEISLSFIETINGVFALAFVNDVTTRKQLEVRLRDNEELFHVQVECVKDYAIFMMDPQGYILNWNPGAERLKGYTAEEIIGRHFSCFYSEEDRAAGIPEEELNMAVAAGQAVAEGWRSRKDGSSFWAEIVITALYNEDGILRGFSKVTHDITGRKKVEDALRISEDRYRALFEDNPTMILTLDAEWTILSCNPFGASQLGYTVDELKGRSALTLLPADDQAAVVEQLLGCLKEPNQAHRWQSRKVTKDGAILWVEETAQALYDLNGALNVLLVCQDITGRKQAEEGREQLLLQLEAVLENINEGVVIYDHNATVLKMNKEALTMHGYENEVPAQRQMSEYQDTFELSDFNGCLIPVEQWPMSRALRGERFANYEVRVRRKDTGKTLSGSYSGTPVPNKSGDIILFVITMRDITEQKSAEEALRGSEALFHAIFDQAAVGIAQVSLSGQWLMMNQKLADTLGYSFDELGKMTLQQISHPDDLEPHLARVRSLLAGEVPAYAMEKRYICKRGTTLWVNLNVTLVRDQYGKPLYFIAIVEDINKRKKAQDDLRESEERFRNLADTAPVLIWMSGTDNLCTFFNKPWLEFTGRTLEQEQGNGWAEGVHPEDLKRCKEIYISAFNARRDFKMEYRLRRADGEYRWMVDTGIPRFMPNGDFAGYIGSCIDITERKYAEVEIRKLNMSLKERTAELEETNKELETFNYTVAHDLRQPLNVISGYCQAIIEFCSDQLQEDCKDYIREAYNGTLKMNRLLDALLNFSRLVRAEPRRDRVDLSMMAHDAAKALKLTEPGRQVDFQIADGIAADGDPELLKPILDNLLGNAFKYTALREMAVIEFGAKAIDGMPTYFVRDNGAGFDMADAAKLFAPFQRLPGAQDQKGFGIGLATVERIVRRHGGKVWAEGEPDKGACIYFTLAAGTGGVNE